MLLTDIPTDIVLHLVRSYLMKADLLSLGQTNMQLLQLTQRCDLILPTIEMVDIGTLIRDRVEADVLFASLTSEQQRHMLQTFAKVKVKVKGTKQLPPPEPRSTSKQKYQIGRITSIHIPSTYGNKILRHILPRLYLLSSSIRTIKLAANIEIEHSECRFPSSLTRLVVTDQFACGIEDVNFPSGLQELIFDPMAHFHSPIEGMKLPSSLRTLHFNGSNFNSPIEGLVLPQGFTDLKIEGGMFNQSVGKLKLPDGLRKLTLSGTSFNHSSFEYLKLPSSLTHLTLGRAFIQSSFMCDWIPPYSLTRLDINSECRLRGDIISLPPSDLTFTLPDPTSTRTASSSSSLNFRDYLTHIHSMKYIVGTSLANVRFPSSLTYLRTNEYTQPLDWNEPPSNLRELIFSYGWKHPISTVRLPSSLTRLEFSCYCYYHESLIDMEMPPLLEELSYIINYRSWQLPQDPRLPPRTPFPPTMRRIDLHDATQEWLQLDLPPLCQIYERPKGVEVLVTRERIEQAKASTRSQEAPNSSNPKENCVIC